MGRPLLKRMPWLPATPPNGHTYVGETITTSAAYHQRDGGVLIPYGDRYWLLGGWWPEGTPPWCPAGDGSITTTNEVWSAPQSAPGDWTQHLEHLDDPPTSGPTARWPRRHTFPAVPYRDAVWVLGGDLNDGYKSDVWRSTDPANTWARIAASSPWGPMYNPGYAVYRDWIHILGGFSGINSDASRAHWRTQDGLDWERLPDMPFDRANTSVCVLDGLLFAIGGSSRNYGDRIYRNDTWAFNGAKWRRMSASAIWSPGDWIMAPAYDNKLWVATRNIPGNTGGLFYSEDLGATYQDASSVAPWGGSHADAYCATEDGGIVIASGNGHGKNVYRVKRAA